MMISNIEKKKENRIISFLFLFGLFVVPVIIYAYALSNMQPAMTVVDVPTVTHDYVTDMRDDFIVPANTVVSDSPVCQELTNSPLSVQDLIVDDYDTSFFENSVFVGDSISVGFENYCHAHADSILTDSTYFLARVSCSAQALVQKNAIENYANIIPLYQGKVQLVEDSISQMDGIEKVFICYGVNDLVGCSPEEYINNIDLLVSRILEKNPDVSVYMISIPCVYTNVSTGSLNNPAIQKANALLYDTCLEKGWGFINVVEYLMNPDFSIRQELSSDGYVHQNNRAYDIWTNVLKNYARKGNNHE